MNIIYASVIKCGGISLWPPGILGVCLDISTREEVDGILPPKLCMGLTGPGPVLVSGQSTHLLVLQVKTTVNVTAQQNSPQSGLSRDF